LGEAADDRDSDADGVFDKSELHEVYFNAAGDHALNVLGADADGDGLRKEVDPDNDDGGSLDGCEDRNPNGRFQVALCETDNFDAADHVDCGPPPAGMVLIPGGECQMGCDPSRDDNCYSRNTPIHLVFLDGYYMDLTEVTNAHYAQCVADGACDPPFGNESETRPSYDDNADYANNPSSLSTGTTPRATAFGPGSDCRPRRRGRRRPAAASARGGFRGATMITFSRLNYYYDDVNDIHCVGDTTEVGAYPSGASLYGVLDVVAT
jgi:hypothetical protein